MKKQLIETTPPIMTKESGWWITVQLVRNILVLNIFDNMFLQARHCINIDSHEFMTLKNGAWYPRRIENAMELRYSTYYYYRASDVNKRFRMSKEDEEVVLTALKAEEHPVWRRRAYDLIDYIETECGRKKREKTEMNRIARVNAVMNKMPPIPEGIKEWINQRELGGKDYATKIFLVFVDCAKGGSCSKIYYYKSKGILLYCGNSIYQSVCSHFLGVVHLYAESHF